VDRVVLRDLDVSDAIAARECGAARTITDRAPGRIRSISLRPVSSAATGAAPQTGAPCAAAIAATSDNATIACTPFDPRFPPSRPRGEASSRPFHSNRATPVPNSPVSL